MPNHVVNHLCASEKVISSLKSDQTIVDFDTVVPMPESLHVNPHSGIEDIVEIAFGLDTGRSKYLRLKNIKEHKPYIVRDNDLEILIACLQNQEAYGYMSWYRWALDHWGTKWGAYSIDEERSDINNVYFQTAWSAPDKIFEALAKKFPDEKFTMIYADEDASNNTGQFIATNGAVERHSDKCGSKDAWCRYLLLHHHNEKLDKEFIEDYGIPKEVIEGAGL